MASGDITDLMVDELGLRLEDSTEKKFTEVFKLKTLNNAQIRLAQLLHNQLLTELEDVTADTDISSGSVALSTLNSGNGVLRGSQGILNIQVDPGGAGSDTWAHEIEVKDLKRNDNNYLQGTDANPVYYVFKDAIYFLMGTLPSSTANIFYLKMPDEMTTSVDPELNVSLHPTIVTLAEADSWAMAGQMDRRQAAIDRAYREIEILNARVTLAPGVGLDKNLI